MHHVFTTVTGYSADIEYPLCKVGKKMMCCHC